MTPRPDSFQIVSTFGVVLDTTPLPHGGYSYTPYLLLPEVAWSTAGSGVQGLDPGLLSGEMGTIEVSGQVGALGTAQVLFTLSTTDPPSIGLISVQLTVEGRLMVVHQDLAGTIVAQVVCSKTYATGDSFLLRYVWDASSVVLDSRHAAVFVNGEQDISAMWSPSPTAPWIWFRPAFAAVSTAMGGVAAFVGAIDKVQVSAEVLIPMGFATIDSPWAGMIADSQVTADATII